MTTASAENPVENIPAPKFTAKNKPVTPKITDPQQVRGIHQADWDADIDNRLTRAYVQGMLEGKPPYNPQRMKDAGLAGCCNIDWRYGQKAIRDKMKPYVMMLQSLPTFLSIKTKFGTQAQRTSWGRRMSEHHTRILRSWEGMSFRHQYCALYTASHGVAFGYFDNDLDWRWNISTLGEMVVPRLSKADADEFSRMSMVREYEPSYLWNQIKEAVCNGWEWSRPKTKDGWHVPTVIMAIEGSETKEFFKSNDFERNEIMWKNKEVVYSQSSKVIKAVMMWTKEDDGFVSQHIATHKFIQPKDSKKKEEFMYKRPKHFQSMRQGVITFKRDIGTNGFFHSIRGTGSDIFPIVQELNKMECSMYDAIKMELKIPVEATDEVWNSDMAYVEAGPFMLIREGVKIADRASRDFSKSAFPGIQTLKQNLADQAGSSKIPEQPGSKLDLQDLLNNISELDIMENVLFFMSWQRLLRESLRRMVNLKTQEQPGGSEALEFRRLCLEDGIPEEAINQIDIEACLVVRPIGNGSPQARMYTMDAMDKLVPFFDEEGRTNYVRDSVASLPGVDWSMVDRYAPQEADLRPTEQVRFALDENVNLKLVGVIGDERIMSVDDVPVLPNDDHITHLETQTPAMMKIVQLVEQGQMLMEEAVRPLFPLYIHCSRHVELAMDNPIMRNQISQFRMALHNVGEIITNGQRKLQAQEQKAQENAAKGLDPDGNPLPGQGGEPSSGKERPIYPDPMGTGALLTPSEFSMVARTQIHLQDAQRNAANAQALHDMKVQEIRQQAADKAAASRQRRQITDLRAAAALTR